jgi:hypothetical protein
MELQRRPLVDNGRVSAQEMAEFITALDRPEARDVTALLFSARGRRPEA